MSARFSVVIPLYNKEEYIGRTVRSVLNQTISDFEIVIVDDGSRDRSAEIVKAVSDSRIRLITQENQGVSAARNTGISNAVGKYICFLDADDLWNADFLETASRLIEKYPQAQMFCPSYQVAYGNRMIVPRWKSVDPVNDSLAEDFFEMATGSFWVCHSSCAVVERSAFNAMDHLFAVGESVYEDFDFWIRLGSKIKVAHSNKVCATYVRITNDNARTAHSEKVVYSKAYMDTLDGFLSDPALSAQQVRWIREIRDRRIVPYIFSLLCTGRREEAKNELKEWMPVRKYGKYKAVMKLLSVMPCFMIDLIQTARYYLF